MKYICLGYMNEEVWNTLSENERNTFMDECFTYDRELRENGHFVGGEALQEARNAASLRWQSDRISVTDGPFVESKEQIGGIMILEANDLNHAIRLLSKHPSLRLGRGGNSWEIRPAANLAAFMEESDRRGKE
jgi:hypothetical protein